MKRYRRTASFILDPRHHCRPIDRNERARILTLAEQLEHRTKPEGAMRQIAGAFAELEKARLVAKLRGARERKRDERKSVTIDGRGKCEGRKSLGERSPELVAAASALNDGRSLRKIAAVFLLSYKMNFEPRRVYSLRT